MSTDILWRSGNAVEVLSFCLTAFLYYSFHRSVSDSVSDRNAEREIWQNGSLFCMFLLFCDQPSVPLCETEREIEEENCEQTENHLKNQLPAGSANRICRHQTRTAALLSLCCCCCCGLGIRHRQCSCCWSRSRSRIDLFECSRTRFHTHFTNVLQQRSGVLCCTRFSCRSDLDLCGSLPNCGLFQVLWVDRIHRLCRSWKRLSDSKLFLPLRFLTQHERLLTPVFSTFWYFPAWLVKMYCDFVYF